MAATPAAVVLSNKFAAVAAQWSNQLASLVQLTILAVVQ
jgi:hypothetical protein